MYFYVFIYVKLNSVVQRISRRSQTCAPKLKFKFLRKVLFFDLAR